MARIFVLEDEEHSRKALVQMLLKISDEITVDAAANLTEARLLLDSTVSFDLFLLDINLNPKDSEDISGILLAHGSSGFALCPPCPAESLRKRFGSMSY